MNIQDYIEETFEDNNGYCFRERVIFKDGFSISIQGSSGHYCSPRKTQDWYNSLELGFPSEDEPLIFKYAESNHCYTDTVYGWVPVEIVQELINKHGGFK